MISHKYKCIFIHIQRTGGTSIERWILGDDMWSLDKERKHLLASQAKEIYADYWNSYFKFAFIRNPWDRTVSCLNFGAWLGIRLVEQKRLRGLYRYETLDISEYKNLYGFPVTIECDRHFYTPSKLVTNKHKPHSVYGNILDEPIDFIGRFENLPADTLFLREKLGIPAPFDVHVNSSSRKRYRHYYDRYSREAVRSLYERDLTEFTYSF